MAYSDKPLYIWGKEIKDLGSFANMIHNFGLFLVVQTYRKQVKIIALTKSNFKLNFGEYLKTLEDAILEDIKNTCK